MCFLNENDKKTAIISIAALAINIRNVLEKSFSL